MSNQSSRNIRAITKENNSQKQTQQLPDDRMSNKASKTLTLNMRMYKKDMEEKKIQLFCKMENLRWKICLRWKKQDGTDNTREPGAGKNVKSWPKIF